MLKLNLNAKCRVFGRMRVHQTFSRRVSQDTTRVVNITMHVLSLKNVKYRQDTDQDLSDIDLSDTSTPVSGVDKIVFNT